MEVIPERRELGKEILLCQCMTGTRPGLTSELHTSRQTPSNITKTLETELTVEYNPPKVRQNF